MIDIFIPYGEKRMHFSLPEKNIAEILTPNKVIISSSEREEIKNAISNPIGTKKLEEIVRPENNVVILCEDISRFAHTDKMLFLLLNSLNQAGISDKNILIIMALGSHRPMTRNEMLNKVGEKIFSRVQVVNSEFKDKRKLIDMGFAPGGVRVWADRRVVQADVKIGVGSIVPHAGFGYTGGGKIIYPGVVGEETVAQLHLHSTLLGRNILGDPDNLARKEIEEWVSTVGLDFILNAIVTPENKAYKIVAGHHVKAHRKGVNYAREIYGIKTKEKVDVAVVSSHTADRDFWQATKGFATGDLIVKNGGSVILVSPCFEGIGPHSSFIHYVGSDNFEELLNDAIRGDVPSDEALPLAIGAFNARFRKRIRLILVSESITREQAKEAKIEYFTTLNEALQSVFYIYGKNLRISVIPYGGDSYPYFTN